MEAAEQVTRLLVQWKNGDSQAAEVLTPLVYSELRRLAAHYLSDERAADTLQPTALVHEAYVRLVAQSMPDWQCRSHFFGVAAHLMRQILVDHARRKRAGKRGAAVTVVGLDLLPARAQPRAGPLDVDILSLDRALEELATFDAQQCRVVEMKFFAGLTIDETAEALGISAATVEREWVIAKAWLYHRLANATP